MSALKWNSTAALVALLLPLSLIGCSDDAEQDGCTKDSQCKGERICSAEGRCVYLDQAPDAGADASSPQDATPEDATAGDADSDDVELPDTAGGEDASDTADASDVSDTLDASDTTVTTDASDATADAGSDADAASVPNECAQYPNVSICVQLEWQPAGSLPGQQGVNGRDMDLHYLHPAGDWKNIPLDIFWNNTTADWNGDGSTVGDPTLVLDAMAGPGPEVVTHDNPEDGQIYTVGAHFYSDNGYGTTNLTARVFIDGQQRYETASPIVVRREEFVEIVGIEWPSGQIITIERVYDSMPTP